MRPPSIASQSWLTTLAVALACMLMAVGWLQYGQWRQLEGSINEGKTSLEWDVFQFQSEQLRLASQLNEALLAQGSVEAMQELSLRYNIFLSRLDIIKNGNSSGLATHSRAYDEALTLVNNFTVLADDYLGDGSVVPVFDGARLHQLKAALNNARRPVQALLLDANARYGEQTTKHLQAIRSQAMTSGATTGLLALLAVALGAVALHLLKIANRRNHEMESIQVELGAALERAKSANLAKGQFLANMSHEIRTPMNAILGMLQLLKKSEIDKTQSSYVEKAQGASRTLLSLVNDVLDFSKIEAGKMSLDPRSFQLSQMLQDLIAVLSVGCEEKSIELRFDLDPDVPLRLVGDDMRLQQVLLNLASNAIKFTSVGEVVVRVRCVASHKTHAKLEFSIRDTGIGIAPENQSRIFDGFTQAEPSTTRRFGGTGLGLAISNRLVTMMGGTLALKSQVGQGSVFSFELELPVAEDAPVNTAPPANTRHVARPQRLRGLRLLLVEDNKVNQMVAAELLSLEGAQVTVADNGKIGVDKVVDTLPGFDLVLMDIQMPVMDGFSATRAIRDLMGFENLPIIAMTANAMARDREACLAGGMNEHVGKPFDIDQLVALILQLSRPTPDQKALITGQEAPINRSQGDHGYKINFSEALVRLGGNTRVYGDVIAAFQAELSSTPARVQAALEESRMEDATRLVHTLKGLAATVGADQLQTQLLELEQALKSEINLPGKDVSLKSLQVTIDATMSELRALVLKFPAGLKNSG
jgi:signal transduction histidine kinase/DNA-binding response OmpR family regulator